MRMPGLSLEDREAVRRRTVSETNVLAEAVQATFRVCTCPLDHATPPFTIQIVGQNHAVTWNPAYLFRMAIFKHCISRCTGVPWLERSSS